MPPKHSVAPARAPRSPRVASALVAAGLVLGLAGATGLAATTPAFAAQAAAAGLTPAAAATPASPAATPGAVTLREVGDDARAAVGAARAALASAGALKADIAASDLDLGVPDTSVDVVPLLEATAQLADLDLLPVLIVPGATEELAEATDVVEERVAGLRERLDAALAKKAAEEAAAEAKRKAEEAAAAAARAAAAANTVDGAKANARAMASAEYGWGADQFSCLESLWTKESGWNYQAYNASSGATGIPQSLPGSKMASAGADWQTNATTQIAWGLQYIASAYGSPCAAWGHSQATDWY